MANSHRIKLCRAQKTCNDAWRLSRDCIEDVQTRDCFFKMKALVLIALDSSNSSQGNPLKRLITACGHLERGTFYFS